MPTSGQEHLQQESSQVVVETCRGFHLFSLSLNESRQNLESVPANGMRITPNVSVSLRVGRLRDG